MVVEGNASAGTSAAPVRLKGGPRAAASWSQADVSVYTNALASAWRRGHFRAVRPA